MNKKNIGIIGTGIGGLTAGALLTKQGHKITIFEKEAFIGGRALSLMVYRHLILKSIRKYCQDSIFMCHFQSQI